MSPLSKTPKTSKSHTSSDKQLHDDRAVQSDTLSQNPFADSIYSSDEHASNLYSPNLPMPHGELLNTGLSEAQQTSLIRYNHVTYLLYALSFFTAGLLWIVPIVMNYYRRREADGTWLASHFDWQIRMFWYSLLLAIVGGSMIFFSLGSLGISIFAESASGALGSVGLALLGGLVLLFSVLWHIYRIVRGWIALSDHRPVP